MRTAPAVWELEGPKSPAVFDQIDASVLKIAEGLNCSVSPVQDDAQQEKEDTQDGKSKHHNGIV